MRRKLLILTLLFVALAATASAQVLNVETVELTLGSGETSDSVTLNDITDTANAVPFATSTASGMDDDWDDLLVDVSFSGSDVVASRPGNDGTVELAITVVEFDPNAVKVQQGTVSQFSGSSSTESITAVNQSKAALVFYYEQAAGSDDWDHSSVAGWFSADDQLSFQRDATNGNVEGHYYVFESLDDTFDVQTESFGIGSGSTSNSVTINSVDTDKTFLIASYRANVGTDNSDDGAVTIFLDSSTQITAERIASSGSITDIRAFAITFSGDENVQHGFFQYPAFDTLETATVSQVDLSVAMPWAPLSKQGIMKQDGTLSDDVQAAFHKLTLTDSTTLQGERDGASNDPALGDWQIIEWVTGAAQEPTPTVEWNQSSLSIGEVLQAGSGSANASIVSSVNSTTNNTNVTVTEESGNGSAFMSASPISHGTLGEEEAQVAFTCSPGAGQTPGTYDAIYNVKSNEDATGQNITVSCKVDEVSVAWNQTTLDIGLVTDGNSDSKNATVTSTGQNTNVTVTEESGNGSAFMSATPTSLGTLDDAENAQVEFTCAPNGQAGGTYETVYKVSSTEDTAGQTITVSCDVSEGTAIRQIITGSGTTGTGSTHVVDFTQGTGGSTLADTSKAFHIISYKHTIGANDHDSTFRSSEITSDSELTIFAGNGPTAVDFAYTIIEFTSGSPLNVQTDSVDPQGNEITTSTFNDVGDLSEAFILHHGHDHDGGDTTIGCEEYDRIRLTSTTQWEVAIDCAPNSGPQTNRVEIVDWNDADFIKNVQRDTQTMTGTSLNITPGTSVDPDHTLIFVSARSTANSFNVAPADIGLYATLDENGNIIVERESSGENIELAWELVEFQTGAATVEHSTISLSDTDASGTATISAVDTDNAASLGTASTPFGHGGARSSDTTTGATQNSIFTVALTDSTTVTATRGGSSDSAKIGVQTINFGEAEASVTWSQASLDIGSVIQGENGTATETVTATQNHTSVTVTELSGNGTDFISASPTSLGNLSDGESANITFTCAPNAGQAPGAYQATYKVNSTEDGTGDDLTVQCTVTLGPGSLSVELIAPAQNLSVSQDETFTVTANVTCENGDCGMVTGTARYGSGEPDTAISLSPTATPFFVSETQLDNDIIVTLFSTTNELRQWDFDGSWQETPIDDVGDQIEGLDLGDVDGDGFDEIVTGIDTNEVRFYDWNGTDWEHTVVKSGLPMHIEDVDVGDADNDGDNDIVIALERTSTGEPLPDAPVRMYKLENDNWVEENISTREHSAQNLHVSDADNDGTNDVTVLYANVVGDETHETLVQVFQKENGTWNVENATPLRQGDNARAERILVGDPDDDDDNDIITAFWDDDTSTPEGRLVKIEKVNGTWTEENISFSVAILDGLDMGDADDDGDIEIAVTANPSTSSGQIRLYDFANGNWEETNVSNLKNELSRDVNIGDANNDGNTDIVASMGDLLFLYENISGTVQETLINDYPVTIDSAKIGDPDHDSADNPLTCGTLNNNDACQLSWEITATGSSDWNIDVLFESDDTSVADVDTENKQVSIS